MDGNLAIIDYEAYSDEFMEDLTKAADKCPTDSLIFVGKPTE